MLAITALFATPCAFSQFVSGSDGSDGAYSPNVSGYFIPSQFHGSGVANNVFNFTTITIPAGVTITLTAWYDNQPVYFLASGNVDIEGTLSLTGGNGAGVTSDPLQRTPAAAGSGGWGGGVGGYSASNQPATAGNGPAGGAAGDCTTNAGGGQGPGSYGNEFLIPLRGGSGGGGLTNNVYSNGQFYCGGGAGGGAILIASSTQIVVGGTLAAYGGNYGSCACGSNNTPGGGGGGAIRLVSNIISGTGIVSAGGGVGIYNSGAPGVVRLEAYTNNSNFNFGGNGTQVFTSTPLNNFYNISIPQSPQASLQVTSVNGIPITENPFTFPDVTINTDQPVSVVITGHQVPIGTVPMLTILGESADQDNLMCAGGMQGTLATSTCTINLAFVYGGSRGLVTAQWQNSNSQK